MGAKRAPSAYFVFANEQRSVTKEELLAAATDGKAPSVADVAKSIGHKWRELGEARQQHYKDKAAALAAEIAANHAETEDDTGTQAEAEQSTDSAEVPGLPLTSVKRIMCLDEDVARVSADAVKGMAKAAELFLELLATKAIAQAKHHKRSTIKFCDMQQAIMADKRFNEMGLKNMLMHDALFAGARTDGKENVAAPRKACKVGADDTPGSRPITAFFKA